MNDASGERIYEDGDQGDEPLAEDDCAVVDADLDEADGTDSRADRDPMAARAVPASLGSADIPGAWVIRDDDDTGGEPVTSCDAEDEDAPGGLALVPAAGGFADLPGPQVYDDGEIGAEDMTTCNAYDEEAPNEQ